MALSYIHLPPSGKPPSLEIQPYKMIIVADKEVPNEWRKSVAEWIYGIGSRYVIAWGLSCEDWHDSVDLANLEAFNFGEIPQQHDAITTWHANEPLSEVFWFAGFCADHPDVMLGDTVILHIAEQDNCDALLTEFQRSQISQPEA